MIAEVVLFNIKPNVDEADFIQAVEHMQPDVERMAGFIDRTLLKNADGQWMDLLHWETLEAAHTAAEIILNLESCHMFLSMIDEETINMMHLAPRFSTLKMEA